MELAVRPKSSYASRSEWEGHKDKIIRLYWDERKTLNEVGAVMEADHGFFATPKMYKARFKSWGLKKNLKSQEAERIKSKLDQGGGVRLPVIRGREIGSKRFKRHLNQAAYTTSPSSRTAVSRYGSNTPPKLLKRLESPKALWEAEGCIKYIMDFTTNRFETGHWNLSDHDYDWTTDTSCSWWVDCWVITEAIERRRDSPDGFKLLEEAFDRYGTLLVDQSNSLVTATLLTVLELANVGPELGLSLLRYVANLSQIKLGKSHPLSRLWTTLLSMGLPQIRRAAHPIFMAFLDILRANSPVGQRYRTITEVHILRRLAKFAALPVAQANARNAELCQEITSTLSLDADDQWLQFARFIQGATLVDLGYYKEADEYLDSISEDLLRWRRNKENYFCQKGRVAIGLGNYDLAIEYFKKMQAEVLTWKVRDLSQEAGAFHQLRNAYALKGDTEMEQKMSILFEEHWDMMIANIRAGKMHTLV